MSRPRSLYGTRSAACVPARMRPELTPELQEGLLARQARERGRHEHGGRLARATSTGRRARAHQVDLEALGEAEGSDATREQRARASDPRHRGPWRSPFVTPKSSRLIEYRRGSASAHRGEQGRRGVALVEVADDGVELGVRDRALVSSDQRARASRTARISAAVGRRDSAASAATARAARCGWPVRSEGAPQRAQQSRGAAARPRARPRCSVMASRQALRVLRPRRASSTRGAADTFGCPRLRRCAARRPWRGSATPGAGRSTAPRGACGAPARAARSRGSGPAPPHGRDDSSRSVRGSRRGDPWPCRCAGRAATPARAASAAPSGSRRRPRADLPTRRK